MDIIVIAGLGGGILLVGLVFFIRSVFTPQKLSAVKTLMEGGNYSKALVMLQSMLKNDDNNPLAHLYLAECYFFDDKKEMAMVEYRQVLKSGKFAGSETERSVHKRLAEIYLQFNQPEEAQKELLLLLKNDPNHPGHLFQVGKIFYDRKMFDQAYGYLAKSQKNGKNDAEINLLLGRLHFDAGRNVEALNAFTSCVKVAPKNAEAHFYLGLLLKNSGNLLNAVKEFDFAETAKDSSQKLKAIYQKGLCKLEQDRLEEARADFERGLKFVSEETATSIALRYSLAEIYEKSKMLLEAVDQWERVSRTQPNYQDVQTKLSQYVDLRMDDRLKDLLTVSGDSFQKMVKFLLSKMGYEVTESVMVREDTLDITGVELGGKWRNVRGGKVLIRVYRGHDEILESDVSALIEKMKTAHSTRVIFITTGKFNAQAFRYSENRPVDLYDRQKISAVLKKITDWKTGVA